MNLFKDIPSGKKIPDEINVVIEVPKGSSQKIEYEEDLGIFTLDRILFSPMFYPLNYGFMPQSASQDGDSLDIMLLSSQALPTGTVVRCRPLGALLMKDEAGIDNKILAVPLKKVDAQMAHITKLNQVSQQLRNEIELFFKDYKKLEGDKYKYVSVKGWENLTQAKKIIKQAVDKYHKTIS